jgi:hypothetical protein
MPLLGCGAGILDCKLLIYHQHGAARDGRTPIHRQASGDGRMLRSWPDFVLKASPLGGDQTHKSVRFLFSLAPSGESESEAEGPR